VSTGGRELVGPSVGSWSYSVAAWLPFGIDALSFAFSAAAIFLAPPGRANRLPRLPVWASFREGTTYLFGHRELRLLALLTGLANLSVNAGLATLVLYATDRQGLSISPMHFGLLLSTMAVGGLAGGLLASPTLRLLGSLRIFVGSLLVEALAWGLIVFTHHALVAGVALALIGMTLALKSVVIMVARQQLVPPQLLGRVISAYRVVGNGMAPVGALLGGLIGSAAGLRASMIFASTVLLPTAALGVRAFRGVRLELEDHEK
jgi:Na+/melibiose symporter-like transporter